MGQSGVTGAPTAMFVSQLDLHLFILIENKKPIQDNSLSETMMYPCLLTVGISTGAQPIAYQNAFWQH